MELEQVSLDWARKLVDLAGEVRALDPQDKTEIIRLGSNLEEMFGEIPTPLASTEFFGSRCLYALQVLYQGVFADGPGLIDAIGAVLDHIHFVGEGDADGMANLSEAADRLEAVLIGQGDKTATEGSAVESAAAPEAETPEPDAAAPAAVDDAPAADGGQTCDLNGIASMMVTVEANDAAAMERIRAAMECYRAVAPPAVSDHVALAAAAMGRYLEEGQDEARLHEVGEAIEAAMKALEDIENSGGAAVEAAEPAPPAAEPETPPVAEIATPPAAEPEPAPGEILPLPDDPPPETAVAADGLEALVDDEIAAAAPPAAAEDVTAAPNGTFVPDDLDRDLAGEYVTECREYLEDSEGALLDLERNPGDMEAVNRVFRAFHTIKGTSSFLQLQAIAELAHKAETILSLVRDGELVFNSSCADLSLRSVDMLKRLLRAVQDALAGGPGLRPDGYADLLAALKDTDALRQDRTRPAAPCADAEPDRGASQTSSFESSVRVRTDRLDRLIDTVGELVIAQSMVAQDRSVGADGGELGRKVAHAGKIVRELQDLSMAMRMVPLKGMFQKMARLVRDLAQKNGKQADFVREGEDTEIDRNMVDLLADPLVHMIRNAVDHGIETPADRTRAGKPARGTVKLSAYHAGGNVIVKLQDDGKGLDAEAIRRKAVEKGIIAADANLTETEVLNLIFEAGFSTAARVTDVSGRGVGMDVVRRNIESLNGRVDISSRLGRGTTFTIRLPLTMAVTDGMLIKVGDQRFIIPTLNIEVSLRPDPRAISTIAKRGEMLALRGAQLPLYRLSEIFGIPDAIVDPAEGLVVVMDTGDRRYAVLVDELLGKLQVVVKSLSESLGKLQGISGGAILGDGNVGLILDPTGLMHLAMARSEMRDMAVASPGPARDGQGEER